MKSLFIFFLVLFVSNLAFSQHSHVAYLTLADSLYAHHNYREAATYYQRAIRNSKQPGEIMLKVARAYSAMNSGTEAEPWYEKAKASNTPFLNEDTYHYAKALIMLEKHDVAEKILEELLQIDPNALFAYQLLDDLHNMEKYFRDSSAYIVTPLSINTPVAEFAPEYYKDGIVFSSAQPQFITNRKYHWDDTHFLKLYYSARISDHNFKKPVVFDKEISTKFHDGPVAFYGNDEKMILNRNQQVKLEGKEDVWMSHLSLFEVTRNTEKKRWEFTPLPFDEPPYSFAHPAISEDGNTLYFISDKPGGYGGTDIYRAIRTEGRWSTPFNVGPSINTSENEVFPFFVNNTLYFASDGHGGLGGLDLFKSTLSVNGFAPPANLGYPFNSHVDDFSLITTTVGETGYFSSARSGNDDLFAFRKSPEVVKLLARVYDGVTKQSLPGSSIELISITADDTTLVAGNSGYIQFELPRESAYILIASKDGMRGVFSGLAVAEDDHRHIVHQVPLFGDTTSIVCIGNIVMESGIVLEASAINIIDENTGAKNPYTKEQSLISFLAERGHTYRIEVQNAQGDTTVHKLEINKEDKGYRTWSMILKQTPVVTQFAARVFNADNNMPLAGASVKVITLAEPDQDLTANENGVVEFSLPIDAAYIVIGSKDGLTGMNSGIAQIETNHNALMLPVPAKGDPLRPVPVVALVTDQKGGILGAAKATITDKATGETVPGELRNGVLNFFGEHGKSYNIKIEHNGYHPTLEELSIPEDAKPVEKIAVVLEEIEPVTYFMAARIFKETDQSPMAGANVKIISFSNPDLDLIADEQGNVEFKIDAGEGYIVVGTKDGFTGMHMGVAATGTDKASIIHPVPLNNDPASILEVFGMVKNESGEPIVHAEVTVIDTRTGEKVPAKIENGILSFNATRGGNYRVVVSAENYASQEKTIPADSAAVVGPLVLNLNREIPVIAKIGNKKGDTLNNVTATVSDKITGQKFATEFKNGELTFTGVQGRQYSITVEHEDHQTVVEDLIIPPMAKEVAPFSIALSEKNILLTANLVADGSGEPVTRAQVTVTNSATGERIETKIDNGVLSFAGQRGGNYKIDVIAEGYQPVEKHVNIDETASSVPSLEVKLLALKSVTYPMAARVFKESDKSPIVGAGVKVLSFSEDMDLVTNDEGIVDFTLPEGSAYIVIVSKEGYTGMHSGLVEKGSEKAVVIHPVPANNDSNKQLPIFAFVADENGKPLTEAEVKVTDLATGQQVESKIENGILSYYSKKGGAYKIAIEAEGYEQQERSVNVDPDASVIQPLEIRMERVRTVTYPMAARVFKESDKSPIAGAGVKILSFSEDMDLVTNDEGIVDFTLPEGSAYIVIVSKEGYTGMHSGLVEKGSEKAVVIHPVPANNDSNKQLPIFAFVADENGKPLTEAEVKVTDLATGQQVESKIENGILSYYSKKGGAYKIAVEAEGYVQQERSVNVDPDASVIQPLEIRMERVRTVTYPMAARVFKESDKSLIAGANVKVLSFSEDMELVTNDEGIVDFTLPEGSAYIVIASKEGYMGMHSGLVEKGSEKAVVIHPVPANNDSNKQLPIFAFVADENGKPLTEAEVKVTDLATGQQVESKIENGILSYYSKKGGAYKIAVEAEGYEQQERSVNVDPDASVIQPLEIRMERVRTVTYPMAARVFKESDNSPLEGAEVIIMSFPSPDIELVANGEGIVDFTLPEGAPYIIIANRDGYLGIHSGIVETNTAKSSVIHPIPATNNLTRGFPVLALVSDENGKPLTPAQVKVTDNVSGQAIEAKIENGILSFNGNKGGDYKIEISSEDYEPQTENIRIDPKTDFVRPLEISVTRKKLFVLPPASNLIILNNETPRFYVTSNNNHNEIIEKDGMLYLQSKEETKPIGKGTLSALMKDPARIIALSPDQAVTLQNIYFDFNSAALDATDKEELGKVKVILNRYPLLQLTVRAHADLRGSATYNMSLTRKRARAIKSYLVKQRITSRKIFLRAFGKSAPVILCETKECTEQQHQKNRRAEFELAAVRRAKLEPLPVVKPQPAVVKSTARTRLSPNYAKVLAKYGDRQHEDLVFKVCVGAYRLNPDLTFTELTDLGQVEKRLAGGINYYYLHDFATLQTAENIRQKVIQRGISDAYITIFYKDRKITFSDFVTLTN